MDTKHNREGWLLVIHEDDCNGEALDFQAFVAARYPEIEIDYVERTSGVGDGLFDSAGDLVEERAAGWVDLWVEYCNS